MYILKLQELDFIQCIYDHELPKCFKGISVERLIFENKETLKNTKGNLKIQLGSLLKPLEPLRNNS